MSSIRIPVSYLADDDGAVILLTEDERSRLEWRARDLREAGDSGKADAVAAALSTDAELRALPAAVHTDYRFRRPTTQDRLLIRHKAYTAAEANGPVTSDWLYEQYVRLAAMEHLREDAEPMPDDIVEHVALLLETALAPKGDVSRFLPQRASASPEATR